MEVSHLNALVNFFAFENLTWTFSNFRGAGPGCNTQEIGEKLARLRNEVAALESLENTLDQHKQVCVT